MPKHPHAIGYLTDLAEEINEPWFTMVCDLAVITGAATLEQAVRETLLALYMNKASYIGMGAAAGVASSARASAPVDFLEHLAEFANFKLLRDAFEVSFEKRITLIFGTNGSGKSSVCEALKALATPDTPIRPLHNVRNPVAASPSFHYKFRTDPAPQIWTSSCGYGPRRATIRYFDTAIAVRNVKNPVEPGRVIALIPFKLHVFEQAKALTTEFRKTLQQAQQDDSEKLAQALEAVRRLFADFQGHPLATIDRETISILPNQIRLGEGFSDQQLLAEKRTLAAELEKTTSEEGMKLLAAEYRELENFLTSLDTFLTSASGLWAIEPAEKALILLQKRAEQEALAKALVPKDGTLEALLALLRAASPLCRMEEANGSPCPLCKRDLGISEVELFRMYHDLLAGELEKEILALKGDIATAEEFAAAVANVDRQAWEKCPTLSAEILATAKVGTDLILTDCSVSREPTDEAKASLESLRAAAVTWAMQLEAKRSAIEIAAEGATERSSQLMKLFVESDPLEYAQAICDHLVELREAQRLATTVEFWNLKLPAFTQLLRKITDKAKEAHEELVVADFESRLNAEYKALTEKDMAAFGVLLVRKGADAAVTVIPQIGGKQLEEVFSEGEQRVHALALFFAELETTPQPVLVFDDPISSFDYNYIANYCARLRDFVQCHATHQVIVLTHNWEFFVQLQSTLNQSGLDSHLSVQVLENCALVTDYSEKIDDLKRDIEAALITSGEPSTVQKERLAGNMRRLIEAVVNTHVFNHQRHQYKQKSQPITAFQSFTKIVPLLQAEATILRDLYGKLSVTEHDDPRNAYVNTDKAMFQTRYEAILAVEAAVAGRK